MKIQKYFHHGKKNSEQLIHQLIPRHNAKGKVLTLDQDKIRLMRTDKDTKLSMDKPRCIVSPMALVYKEVPLKLDFSVAGSSTCP